MDWNDCVQTRRRKPLGEEGREIISCIDLIYITSFYQLYVLLIKFCVFFYIYIFSVAVSIGVVVVARFLLATKLNSCHSISGLLVEGGFQS